VRKPNAQLEPTTNTEITIGLSEVSGKEIRQILHSQEICEFGVTFRVELAHALWEAFAHQPTPQVEGQN